MQRSDELRTEREGLLTPEGVSKVEFVLVYLLAEGVQFARNSRGPL